VLDSLLIYSLIGKIATSVTYKSAENKIEITHLGTTFLKPKTEKFDPQDLIKHRKKSINPLIGYKQVEANKTFATESMATWHDRRFLDSIIRQPKLRTKVASKEKSPKKKDMLD